MRPCSTSLTPIDWLEVITENYLVPGGKPLALPRAHPRRASRWSCTECRCRSAAPIPIDLRVSRRRCGRLAARIEPHWISDHLCWTGVEGRNLHDLLPLPYTEEALASVVARVGRSAGRRSAGRSCWRTSRAISTYRASEMSEWEFLREVARRADCAILLDINNIYVSSVNHGFDPLTLPARRPQGARAPVPSGRPQRHGRTI